MEKLLQKIKSLSSNFSKDIISIRRHLHSYPELSFQEHKTLKYIVSQLKSLNLKIKENIVKTGIEVILEGEKKNTNKKVIALRADIDALPIVEQNNIEYKSKNNGIMHACGHDVHTASLIGVIKILNELKNEFSGIIKFIFQPGEEKLPGGASLMIKEGILKNPIPSVIFGQHVFPNIDVGKIGFCNKVATASTDEIRLKIIGKGGHAALPNELIDPIVISATIISSLQQLISRCKPPLIPSILSFGKIEGLGATNVIPNEVYIEGTFRSLDEKWREDALKKIKTICDNTAKAMEGKCEVEITRGYPPLKNDEKLVLRSKTFAEEYLGKDNIITLEPALFGEDFAFFAEQIPACFYALGTRNIKKNIDNELHTSNFNVDEDAIKIGMGLMAWLTIKEMENI
ncbi:MAG: amidohydrolase [Bacteroidetes bacterium]|nr:amidohydrolase [Bacteroidota bacterium]